MLYYTIVFFTLFTSILLVFLLLILAVRKSLVNIHNRRAKKYSQLIYPHLIEYISKGTLSHSRLLEPTKKWKRKAILHLLYQLASSIKSKEEINRVQALCHTLSFTKELIQNVKDHRWWIASDTIRKIGKLRLDHLTDELVHYLYSPHYDLWVSSARALHFMNKNEYLIQYLIEKGPDLNKAHVLLICDMLTTGKEADIELILSSFEQVPLAIRSLFIRVLGDRKELRALPYIEKYIHSEDQEVKINVLKAIEKIGYTTLEEEIITLLSSPSWTERMLAIRVVQSSQIERACHLLVSLISDQNWWVRLRSAEALYSFGTTGKDILKRISQNHEDTYARDMALKVLQEKEFEVFVT